MGLYKECTCFENHLEKQNSIVLNVDYFIIVTIPIIYHTRMEYSHYTVLFQQEYLYENMFKDSEYRL